MSRIKREFAEPAQFQGGNLAERLAEELRSDKGLAQPIIDEQRFPTGKLRVMVIWDEWDRLPFEDRTAVILKAYELAEGRDYRDKIALASGLTVPEAHAAGMLPFQIVPAVRKSDPVTVAQCLEAMADEGASTLAAKDHPQLRFSTLEHADAVRKRLGERLPGSDPVWTIVQDFGKVEDWAQR